MTPLTRAALAIWNDVAAPAYNVFPLWHSQEHMPARLAENGFLRARRFEAIDGGPMYFTFYEVEGRHHLEAPPPKPQVPTALETHIEPHFALIERMSSTVKRSSGSSSCGLVCTIRAVQRSAVCPELSDIINGCHFLVDESKALIILESWASIALFREASALIAAKLDAPFHMYRLQDAQRHFPSE